MLITHGPLHHPHNLSSSIPRHADHPLNQPIGPEHPLPIPGMGHTALHALTSARGAPGLYVTVLHGSPLPTLPEFTGSPGTSRVDFRHLSATLDAYMTPRQPTPANRALTSFGPLQTPRPLAFFHCHSSPSQQAQHKVSWPPRLRHHIRHLRQALL